MKWKKRTVQIITFSKVKFQLIQSSNEFRQPKKKTRISFIDLIVVSDIAKC